MKDDNDSNEPLIDKAMKLMGDNRLTSALADMVEKKRGGLGFLLGMLRKRPKAFNPFLMRGLALYSEPEALDRKTAELVAVSAASALRCEHCLEAHMSRAVKEGATMDEVMDTLLISGAIADSSTLSIAFRKYRQLEGKLEKEG